MPRTLDDVRRALGDEFERIKREDPSARTNLKEALERASVVQAVRDILSLQNGAKIPGSPAELDVFEMVVCLMTSKNRKWLSESQVGYPQDQATAEHAHPGAALKSRVMPRSSKDKTDTEHSRQLIVDKHLPLRTYFMQLLDMCILDDERQKYASLLVLSDGGGLDAASAGAIPGPLFETNAWSILCGHEHLVRSLERLVRGQHEVTRASVTNTEAPQKIRELQLASLRALAHRVWEPWPTGQASPKDSLFAQLMVNVSLNRYLLEGWAFKKRSKLSLEIQVPFLEELEKTAPAGFLGLIKQSGANLEEYISHALALSLSDGRKPLTEAAHAKINEQVQHIIMSAHLPEFKAQEELNRLIEKHPMLVVAVMLPLLAWCYLHKERVVNDDTSIHASTVQIISGRSTVTKSGQHMVSLRRLFSTIVYSNQFESISVERLIHHEAYYATVRDITQELIGNRFRGAPLDYWIKRDQMLNEGISVELEHGIAASCLEPQKKQS